MPLQLYAHICSPTNISFHDDLYVVCRLERVVEVFSILRAELWQHAKIQIHQGKTQVWNRGSTAPENIDVLQQAARMVDPDAVVWRGDENIPTEDQGVVILGPRWGTPILWGGICNRSWLPTAFCWSESPRSLICNPLGILLFCASTRANFLLRACRLPPLESSPARHIASRVVVSVVGCRGLHGHLEVASLLAGWVC